MEFSIVGEIDKYLAAKEAADQRGNGFSASDMGRCKLMRYWKKMGVPRAKPEARSLRIFAMGNIVHDFIQSITRETGLSVLSESNLEYKVDGKIWATGHADDLIKVSDNEYILFDYKTVHSNKFHYLKSEADKHYYKQATLYKMMINQSHPEWNITGVRILYISKDDLCMKEMFVNADDAMMGECHNELEYLNHCFENKEQPKAEPEEIWECSKSYCPYYMQCDRGQSVEMGKQQKSYKKIARL